MIDAAREHKEAADAHDGQRNRQSAATGDQELRNESHLTFASLVPVQAVLFLAWGEQRNVSCARFSRENACRLRPANSPSGLSGKFAQLFTSLSL